ncbi:DUF5985 family protein [Noviherbaspirillum denitrificans]|uniref:Uncharacterized protein n=1 Tax=Noviherbaspirillum denitrificans TaxID=1968433 RepID=A0A254T964_9BURK|nr:DUF5985 family protein [Noviherbaspirillum denitrificans]OWW19186.1 hypothetical protein AYR66_06405 [Noviherbaspirillum denitrificans]
MAPLIYALCALTSLLCACLLLRGYRRNGHRLLLWSGICFAGMTVNNVLLILDRVVFPDSVDLMTLRLASALAALLPLLYGLIWEEE